MAWRLAGGGHQSSGARRRPTRRTTPLPTPACRCAGPAPPP